MHKNINTRKSNPATPTQNRNVYGYIRVSTETQAEKGYGLDIQENAINKYCVANNLNLLDTFIDAGKSGTIGEKDNLESRPAITELLYTLNGTKTILVMNTSRLWRDNDARALVSMAVKKSNGDIISIEQPRYSLYSEDPQDFLFNSMMEMLDQYERMTINKRLTNGKNEKARQGFKPAGRAPLGYKWDKETRQIEINSQEATVVEAVFELAQKRHSFASIAKHMNSQNLLGRSGKQWSRQSVQVILSNKFYTGVLTHKGEDAQGQHSPIIDKELFEYVQECRSTTQSEMDGDFDDNVL